MLVLLSPMLRKPREGGLCQHVGKPQRGAPGEWTRYLQPEEIPGGQSRRAEGAGGNSAELRASQRACYRVGERIAGRYKENEASKGSDLL